MLWGWLQVHERLEAPCKQFSSHPHSFVSTRGTPGHRNSLRTPLKHLTFDAAVPGYGCFTNWKEQLSLTDPEAETMSAWRLPSFFYRALSRCNENPTWWRKGEWCGLSYRGYGQEFVFSLPQQDQPALNAVDKWASRSTLSVSRRVKKSARIGPSPRLIRLVVYPRLVRDPVDFPGLASVVRERLFEVRFTGGDVPTNDIEPGWLCRYRAPGR